MTKFTYQEKAQQQHLEVQQEIESSLVNKQNFVVKAGAGAGKTKSLVDSLIFIREKYKRQFIPKRKKIAVITYTNDAADEITERIGEDNLFSISTIHSFAWDVLKSFKRDLITAIRNLKNNDHITDVMYDMKDSTDEIYYLRHHEVLTLFHDFIKKDLFKDLIVKQYPVILIDEYQDTQTNIINAFLDLSNYSKNITLGLFGDPMQRIYTSGDPQLEGKLKDYNFKQIYKEWNWRSSEEIVAFINRSRALQTNPNKKVADYTSLDFKQKSVHGKNKRKPIIKIIPDNLKVDINPEYKILILEHRMVAIERGFSNLFDLFDDRENKDRFREGSIPELQSIEEQTMELYESTNKEHKSIKIMHYIKEYNELFSDKEFSYDEIKERLDELSNIYERALELLKNKDTSFKEYYKYVRDKKLFYIDKEIDFEDEPWKQLEHIHISEYIEYLKYLDESPFSTKHSSKGLEYENVCVVINQSKAKGNLLNFNQLFRISELSPTIKKNHNQEKDTILTRTSKLFYVAVSRAMEGLLIHLHVPSSKIKIAKMQMETLFEDVARIKVID